MGTYLIKLTPLGRFFFGGELTFGKKNENYFVRSMTYPQQTTLLGMLRFYLLQQHDILDKDGKIKTESKEKVESLIGPSGFNPDNKGQSYGIIKKISPVFLIGPEGPLFVQSREFAYIDLEDEITRQKKRMLNPLCIVKRNNQYHYLIGTQKIDFPELLVNAITGSMCSMKEIFVEDEQPGIKIPDRSEETTIEKSYYRQVGYRFPPDYGFVFYAELANYNGTELEGGYVKMGADKSYFKIDIISKEENLDGLFVRGNKSIVNHLFTEVNKTEEKIVLLSDTYIKRNTYDQLPFVSADTTVFRFIQTVSSGGTYLLKKAGVHLKKSSCHYVLLKKGSVFYVDSDKKKRVISEIENEESFRRIGYNYAI
jgi:CRISPR-associated protein Cmr3